MGLRFIFMLTHNDITVADAADYVETARALGVQHIGFKDVGLPYDSLKRLNSIIKKSKATSYLEVVSLDRDSEIASARAAVEIGVDFLLGGVRVDDVIPILAGSGIKYYPFSGKVVDYPSILEGTIEEITNSAEERVSRQGVDGLDLLAYRSSVDAQHLIKAVSKISGKPVIVAGSINSAQRIAEVHAGGAAGFTIGTAAFEGEYPAKSKAVGSQLAAILDDVARLNRSFHPAT